MEKTDEEPAVTVKVRPDLSIMRAFLEEMLAVVDKYDAKEYE